VIIFRVYVLTSLILHTLFVVLLQFIPYRSQSISRPTTNYTSKGIVHFFPSQPRAPYYGERKTKKRSQITNNNSNIGETISPESRQSPEIQGARVDLFPKEAFLPSYEKSQIENISKEDDLLNSIAHKYNNFFKRVSQEILATWRPIPVINAYDPERKKFLFKDRKTILKIELDSAGFILNITTVLESGADFLDEEATAAFRRIKQFPNPPRGLVVNGKITFTFGFLVYNNNNNFILKF